MGEKGRVKKGVPVLRITRGGEIYRVVLKNRDYFFLSREDGKALISLRVHESLRVLDMGRVFILWRERRRILAYERAPE